MKKDTPGKRLVAAAHEAKAITGARFTIAGRTMTLPELLADYERRLSDADTIARLTKERDEARAVADRLASAVERLVGMMDEKRPIIGSPEWEAMVERATEAVFEEVDGQEEGWQAWNFYSLADARGACRDYATAALRAALTP